MHTSSKLKPKHKWHDIEQNSDEWLDLRMGKVTASMFGTIMANNGKAFGDPAKAYALKLALERCTGQREDSFSNEHTERGHAQEPLARLAYEDTTFSTVANGGFFDCGEYGDSPDGLVCDDGVLEIKSVIPKVQYATLRRGSFDPAYRWQLIGHLDCTGREWVDFASYCAGFTENHRLLIHRVWRKDVLQEIDELNQRRNTFLTLVREIQEEIA